MSWYYFSMRYYTMARKKKVTYNDNNLAIAYFRCSSNKQETSIEQQDNAAKEYAKAHGFTIVKSYIDDGISGTTSERPGFQQMLSEVKHIKPAALILWKVDRLARNDFDMAIAKKTIEDSGCKIHYVAEITPDGSPESYLMEGILEKFSSFYSKQLAVNVRRGQQYNTERGLYLGVKVLGYTTEGEGRHNKRYVIDPVTSPIVKRIFSEYVNGMSMQKICDMLNSEGRKTLLGNKFTINSIRTILHNDAYIGYYRYSDVVIEDGMPKIISKELFEEAQKKLAHNKKFGAQNARGLDDNEEPRFWLTGKLYCGECGDSMQGTSGRSHTGTKYYYYSCNDHHKGKKGNGCKKRDVKKQWIEDIICKVLSEFLQNTENLASLAVDLADYYKKEHADKHYLESLQADLKTTESALKNVIKAIMAGASGETINSELNKLESQKKALMEAIEVEKAKSHVLEEHTIHEFFEKFKNADMNDVENRDIVLNYFVDKIYLYDDRILITSTIDGRDRDLWMADVKALRSKKGSTTSRLAALDNKRTGSLEPVFCYGS